MRGLVTTVGRLVNYPNAVNVIPDRVEFTIDMRAPDDALLAEMDVALRGVVNRVAKRDASRADFTETEAVPACPMDAALVEHIRRVAGPGTPDSVSGALHDSAVLAPHIPTAMLFVPSKDGISHNPAEFSRVEDIAGAAAVVERLVRRTSLRWLNNSGRDDFVGICGGFYEHSSWVAARAWARRPFASIGQLHETMSGIVRAASVEEQLDLVRAHPDLVGRLARAGRLTRESAGEQAAAGLDSLSDEEIAAFERYNAAYRERFGFPFVICARENRKDAILAAFPRRLANSREQEIATALAEIDKIARLRMQDAIWED
jgi:OHCU decarboxylase